MKNAIYGKINGIFRDSIVIYEEIYNHFNLSEMQIYKNFWKIRKENRIFVKKLRKRSKDLKMHKNTQQTDTQIFEILFLNFDFSRLSKQSKIKTQATKLAVLVRIRATSMPQTLLNTSQQLSCFIWCKYYLLSNLARRILYSENP